MHKFVFHYIFCNAIFNKWIFSFSGKGKGFTDTVVSSMQQVTRRANMMQDVVHILSVILLLLADSLVYKVTVSFVASTETVSSFVESHQGRKHAILFSNSITSVMQLCKNYSLVSEIKLYFNSVGEAKI